MVRRGRRLLLLQIIILYAMGSHSYLRMRLCEAVRTGVNTPATPSTSLTVHAVAYHSRLPVLLFAWLLFRNKPLSMRLSLAVLVEAAWEILENSPIIIDRYRTATMALGYTGDSILNSRWIRFSWPWFPVRCSGAVWLTVLIAMFFEIFTGWLIRDNLTLNVVMLVWPVDVIKEWQNALPQM